MPVVLLMAAIAASAGAAVVTYSYDEQRVNQRLFVVNSASFDLGDPTLAIEALSPRQARTALNAELPEMAAGVAARSSQTISAPLMHEGQWLSLPDGLWSAVGWTADHRPVFASGWLGDDFPAQVSLSLGRDDEIPVSLNAVRPGHAALFTDDYFESVLPADVEAFWALLVSGSDDSWFVKSIDLPRKPVLLNERQQVLSGSEDAENLLREHVHRGDVLRFKTRQNGLWAQVQEAVLLGLPLVWQSRQVTEEDLTAEARLFWDVDAPAAPVLAFLPRENRMLLIWSTSRMLPLTSLSRQDLIERLLELGASFACELPQAEEPVVAAASRNPGLARAQMNRLGGEILFIRQKASGAPVNLCRLEQVECNMDPGAVPAPQVIDGRWSEETFPDCAWQMPTAAEPQPIRPSLVIDLKREYLVNSITIRHAESVGFSADFNTRHFKISGREGMTGSWDLIEEVHSNSLASTTHTLEKPERMRFVKIEILRADGNSEAGMARIAEISIWGAR